MLTEKVNIAITDQMIRELRSRLQIGDLVQVLKWDGWKGQKRDEAAARRVVCPIVGIYKHLVTVRLEEGYLESFTYVDLFRQYDIKYLTMTEKKRTRYLNLVKKRAYTLNQYESTGKEKYLRKVDAIDKVLDELVIVMDQTRRLCG